jgi:hypothetical protein
MLPEQCYRYLTSNLPAASTVTFDVKIRIIFSDGASRQNASPRGCLEAEFMLPRSRLGLDMFVPCLASASYLLPCLFLASNFLPCLDLDLECAASSRLEADNHFVTLVIYHVQRVSAKHGVKDDFAFLWEHAIFRHPPNKTPLTDRSEILHS